MPLYDYRCDRCGDFRAFRPMDESDRAQPCPACGEACARTLATPFLGGAGAAASSPGWLGSPAGGGRGGWRAACGLGCSHANCGR